MTLVLLILRWSPFAALMSWIGWKRKIGEEIRECKLEIVCEHDVNGTVEVRQVIGEVGE